MAVDGQSVELVAKAAQASKKEAGKHRGAKMKLHLESPALNVFLGTLPLLGAIVWGLIQNDRRLLAIDKRIDGVEARLTRIDSRLDSIDGKLSVVSERVVKVETRLEGGQVVLASR